MKNNTTDAKRLIQQAINAMPDDYTLSEARYHLKAALSHVDHVEQKRVRRESVQRQNEINARFKEMGTIPAGAIDIKESIKAIDDMIAVEQKKLDEIAAKRRARAALPVEAEGDEVLSD